jgi:MscS family membrane protein
MLFTINDLGFSIAGLLLEGWLAFAARCVCALALLFIGWVVSRWLQKSLFPRLLKRSWHFAFTHPLLESFARPAARIAWYTGMYLALRSLPWAIPGLAALLLKAYRMMLVFLIGTGFYHASGIAALLLASSSEEVRTNRTLLTLRKKDIIN